MLALRLKEEDLGKKVKVADTEVWTHVAYATEALGLASDAEIESSDTMVTTVRDNLPNPIKKLVHSQHVTLADLLAAIKNLDANTVKEEAAYARDISAAASQAATLPRARAEAT